jgi:hypothetical protein
MKIPLDLHFYPFIYIFIYLFTFLARPAPHLGSNSVAKHARSLPNAVNGRAARKYQSIRGSQAANLRHAALDSRATRIPQMR